MNTTEPLIAPKKCVLSTHDLDQQANSLTNWQQSYDQLSSGGFHGRVDKITPPNMHLFKEVTNRELHQDCQLWPDALWFGIPLNDQALLRINGIKLEQQSLAVKHGSEAFELITPENFEIYGLVLDGQFLNQLAERQGIELRDAHFLKQPCLRLEMPKITGLKHYLQTQLEKPNLMAAPLIEDFLMNLLMNAMPVAPSHNGLLPSYQHRKKVVERVQDYIRHHPKLPVTINELCRIAYVSRRTLQYSFESILGISPLQFLRLTRLNQVRRALKNAPADTTVTEIAEFWGFSHAGQFGQDYKKLFGEPPSETLKRRY